MSHAPRGVAREPGPAGHRPDATRDRIKAKRGRATRRTTWRVVAEAALPILALTALTAFARVLRRRGSRAKDDVRLFNKRALNPGMMKLAGRRHWYASVLRHKGCRSGKEYATPVVAVPAAGDAFIVPLPYGEGVDWLKNVLAAGRARIDAKGETYEIVEPEVIDAEEALPLLDERHRRTWRRFGIERYLRLRKTRHDPGGSRWEELRRFRATHPSRHITVGGVRWEYIAGGEGDEALLILPGGAMVGEAGFTRIPAYEKDYRVIVEFEHDAAFSPEARAALRALHPRASVRTFAGAGHAVMVTNPAEYVAAVRSFLEES